MKRMPFVVRFKSGCKEEGIEALKNIWQDIKEFLDNNNVNNFSVWSVEDFLFCYGEYPDEGVKVPAEKKAEWEKALSSYMDLFSAPGTLSLMYHNINILREDKSLVRKRVFATKLKEGCADEYKRRHDVLIEARGDKIDEKSATSNFTIWHANGYIFGYNEIVKSLYSEPTEESRAKSAVWERRQLEIMDWLTEDVDWLTGEKHDPSVLVVKQY